ncbi:hypothetical protein MSHOH_3452 [Methanosarcina horonobensis HB-1 = JCM 15518]|uniref:HicB-like antitoxin of toxin-antitoxin system domain-containing protein n=1 Tax=Methanosarcina horonobensis HB-1 = JCM 15518 TaxID=1434110 RepID=A0A0E3WUB0_9EURY|nr:type II toxin-antitoxin system HicB family antitoxin [Methanosarcina horonobensis]AKB79935.1 hypothetical protein MSHOH_3452 [Methanosarcina horonobensis HB-1 = JCM 15518]
MEGKSLNYTVLIEQDEDGIYIAKVPDIPGCYTQGKTVEQTMERIREVIQVCLEDGRKGKTVVQKQINSQFIFLDKHVFSNQC